MLLITNEIVGNLRNSFGFELLGGVDPTGSPAQGNFLGVGLTGSLMTVRFRAVTPNVPRVKKGKIVRPGPEFVWDSELVPMPEVLGAGAKKIYFPFDVMEVGRSFTTHRVPGTVRVAIRRFRKEPGNEEREFVVKDAGGKSRCWRIK